MSHATGGAESAAAESLPNSWRQTKITYDLSRNWWVLLIRGVLAVIFGILAVTNPATTLGVLVLFFGAYMLVDGVFSIITSLTAPKGYRGWGWTLVGGVAGVIIGLLTLFAPGVTAVFLLYIIVAWLIVTGLTQVISAISLRKEITGEFFLIIGGVASVLFALYLLINPTAGALAVAWVIGLYAIVFGVMMVVLAFRLRGLRGRLQPRTAQA